MNQSGISNLLTWKVGKIAATALFFAIAAVVFLAPRHITLIKADQGCQTFSDPVFNPFPVSWTSEAGTNCEDFAVISGGVHDSGSAWSDNVTAQNGDTIRLRIYVHNGAASNSDAVMHNVQYSVNLDTSSGSSHSVSATLSASNADSKSGQVTINTDPGAHLELVDGQLNGFLGDMQPCFAFSQVFYISVRVVAPVAPTPTHSINAQQGNRIDSQCLFTGSVNWNTSGYNNVEVTVRDATDATAEKYMSGNASGNSDTPWLQPNHHYDFKLYGDGALVDSAAIDVSSLDCGTTPPPVNKSADIQISQPTQLCAQGIFTANVSWNISGYNNVEVKVKDLTDNSTENLISSGGSGQGNADAPYLTPNHTYEFNLYGDGQKVQSKQITLGSLNCGSTPPPVTKSSSLNLAQPTQLCAQNLFTGNVSWSIAGYQDVQLKVRDVTTNSAEKLVSSGGSGENNVDTPWLEPNQTYEFNLYGDGQRVQSKQITIGSLSCGSTPPPAVCPSGTVTVSPSAILVGQNASVFAPSGWFGGNFSSNNSGLASVSGSLVSGVSSGNVSISGNGFTAPNGATNCSLSPANINITQQISSLSCTASATNVNLGDTVTFRASGGSGNFTWYFDNNIVQNSSNNVFSIAQNSQGQHSTRIVSGNQNATCPTVVVNKPVVNVPPVVCTVTSASSQNIGNIFTFTATGGNSGYNWTAPGDATGQAGINSSNFATQFQTVGNKTVIVTSGDGTSRNSCVVQVNQPNTACVLNSNYFINVDALALNGSVYSTTVRWGSSGNSQIKITQDSSNNSLVTGSNSGSIQVNNLQPGTAHTFYMFNVSNDSACNALLTSTSVIIPSLPITPTPTPTPSNNTYTNSNNTNTITNTNTGNYNQNNNSNINGNNNTIANNNCVNYSCNNTNTYSYINNQTANPIVPAYYPPVYPITPLPSVTNIVYSKRAVNDTKGGVDATSVVASKEDFITYTLTATNNGTQTLNNFVITDDLSSVLPYADMVDNGGGTINGNTITFPAIFVPTGSSVSKSFRVRVKYFLADNLSYVMSNTYGNTVTIRINTPQVLGAFVAPKTGADTNAFAFSGLLTIAFVGFKKRHSLQGLMKMIFT